MFHNPRIKWQLTVSHGSIFFNVKVLHQDCGISGEPNLYISEELTRTVTNHMCCVNHFIWYVFPLWSPNTATALGFPSCHRCDRKELLWWDYDLPKSNVHGEHCLYNTPLCRWHHQLHLFAQRIGPGDIDPNYRLSWEKGHQLKLLTGKVNGWF